MKVRNEWLLPLSDRGNAFTWICPGLSDFIRPIGKFIRQTRNAVDSIFVATGRMHRRAGRLWGTFQEFCDTAARPDRGRPCSSGGTVCMPSAL
jgi:hypothetical protein